MSASGLPGKRVEANRAGMTATICSGYAESTVETVDEGCTANHSTPREIVVLRFGSSSVQRRTTMTKREAAAACAIVVVGLAAWYALSDGSDRGLLRRPAATRAVPTSLDAGATALADEIARLQRMQSPASSPRPARDLFRFAAHAQPQPTSIAPPVVPVTVQPAAPPRPPLKLIGIAEDGAAGSPVRDCHHLVARSVVCRQGRRARDRPVPRREDFGRRRRTGGHAATRRRCVLPSSSSGAWPPSPSSSTRFPAASAPRRRARAPNWRRRSSIVTAIRPKSSSPSAPGMRAS